MTDIVERLRAYEDSPLEPRWANGLFAGTDNDVVNEAADEIERLRAKLDQIRRFALSGEMDTIVSAEIERLRAALRKIAEWDLTGTAISALREGSK